MGIYINPPIEKELWLQENGYKVDNFKWQLLDDDFLPVVWVENVGHTVAVVAHTEDEFNYYISTEHDLRPKKVYIVERDKLMSVVASQFHKYIEEK